MNYFDFNAKATSWDVVDFKPIEVTERELTDEEVKQWIRTLSDLSAARSAASSEA